MKAPNDQPGLPGPAPAPHSAGERLLGLLAQRCPRCLTAPMFRGAMTMNDACPTCGLIFQREEGYFLGATYTSYFLATAILGTSYFVAARLLDGWSSLAVAAVALVPFLPLIPVVFRYSRVLWIYLDRAMGPGGSSAGAYEKVRQRQHDEGKDESPPPPSA